MGAARRDHTEDKLMQQFIYRRLVRKRRWGHACACYTCGAAVFPLPLRTNPTVHVSRGYTRGVAMRSKRTGKLESYAILFCPACADPEDVRDYAQFEPASSHDAAAHAIAVEDARHAAQ
jgi:hypothetical protein